ncbi:serine/threonine protein kinase, partial [Francisella tularensis subsp. holarctica]|nr:serine/threonine protein kinase [Francisella tularensis subsp. holarctica]
LTPQQLMNAKEQNIAILSYLASHFTNSSLDYVAPIVALVAMSKSYFGHYLGSKQSIYGLVYKVTKKKFSEKTIKPITLS